MTLTYHTRRIGPIGF